ncbi:MULTISPECIES: methionine/alanine import family NSS transporter small subunit [unclassified Microbacterium]|uniref:methionine/alanine import family NSS transporter small subunit n=1 Tax=unclassified Microbacterium TaxID=2609290 RepID=UPI000F550FF5|nr:methionine/alanine import family NSS transporter small subunit [Microbacterium sp. ABRD28]AZC13796.1 methionine/alanine import family NSS transporter small subunit [Microbacterium sp. ABRD28]
MTGLAITFLILSIIIVWGGLAVSILFLRSRPEPTEYPPGGTDDHREDIGPAERDT